MSDIDLRVVAKSRVADSMNTWPDHNSYHRRTILGNWLEDYACLRCQLERVAMEKAQETQETPSPNDKSEPAEKKLEYGLKEIVKEAASDTKRGKRR